MVICAAVGWANGLIPQAPHTIVHHDARDDLRSRGIILMARTGHRRTRWTGTLALVLAEGLGRGLLASPHDDPFIMLRRPLSACTSRRRASGVGQGVRIKADFVRFVLRVCASSRPLSHPRRLPHRQYRPGHPWLTFMFYGVPRGDRRNGSHRRTRTWRAPSARRAGHLGGRFHVIGSAPSPITDLGVAILIAMASTFRSSGDHRERGHGSFAECSVSHSARKESVRR